MEVAYRIYPLPKGMVYSEDDIQTIEDVIKLFDYCQILEAIILKDGWEYLIDRFYFSCTFMPMTGMFSRMSSGGDGLGGRLTLVAWCVYFLPVGVLSFLHFRKR